MDPAIFARSTMHLSAATQKGNHAVRLGPATRAQPIDLRRNSWVQAASSPASDPLVTAVGGTELHAASIRLMSLGCDPPRIRCRGHIMARSCGTKAHPLATSRPLRCGTDATGGGFSVLFDEPPYQQGTAPRREAAGGARRRLQRGRPSRRADLPGHSRLAAGYWLYRFGGTSAGSPQWAAITAIANQKAGRAAGIPQLGHLPDRQGEQSVSVSFNDITSGTNSAVEFDSSGNPVP